MAGYWQGVSVGGNEESSSRYLPVPGVCVITSWVGGPFYSWTRYLASEPITPGTGAALPKPFLFSFRVSL
jgi:hypothetical protein